MKELDDESGVPPRRPEGVDKEPVDPFTLMPGRDGYVQFSVRLWKRSMSPATP